MVRIVEKPPVKTCKCHTCKATLEYEYSDIKEAYHRDYGGGGDTTYSLICPSCTKTVYVSRW